MAEWWEDMPPKTVTATEPADCEYCGQRIEVGDVVLRTRPDVHEQCAPEGVERGALDSGWAEWGVALDG